MWMVVQIGRDPKSAPFQNIHPNEPCFQVYWASFWLSEPINSWPQYFNVRALTPSESVEGNTEFWIPKILITFVCSALLFGSGTGVARLRYGFQLAERLAQNTFLHDFVAVENAYFSYYAVQIVTRYRLVLTSIIISFKAQVLPRHGWKLTE